MAKTNKKKESKTNITLNLIKHSPQPKQMTIQTVVDNLQNGCYAVDPFSSVNTYGKLVTRVT